MKDDLVLISTPQDFPYLRIYAAKNVGIAIVFRHLEGGWFWLSLRNFVIGMTYWAIGMLSAWWILESNILLRLNIPEGLPLSLSALAAVFVCIFVLPIALGLWTGISPVPPFWVRREIQIDPMRDQVRVYRFKKMETVRQLSRFYTTTVEEHPKAEIERRKHPGKVGKYQKQHVLYGWFGMGGGEKVPLFPRWEYPYENSLLEVQKAIELAKTLADSIGEAAATGRPVDVSQGFGGHMLPADGGEVPVRGMRPPLD
jgi:hypothetical protein